MGLSSWSPGVLLLLILVHMVTSLVAHLRNIEHNNTHKVLEFFNIVQQC